jgi:hypothetical protein
MADVNIIVIAFSFWCFIVYTLMGRLFAVLGGIVFVPSAPPPCGCRGRARSTPLRPGAPLVEVSDRSPKVVQADCGLEALGRIGDDRGWIPK